MINHRKAVAMLHIGLPLDKINPWSSEQEIRNEIAKRTKEVSFPEDAYAKVWFAFLPDLDVGLAFNVQQGFYELIDTEAEWVSDIENKEKSDES